MSEAADRIPHLRLTSMIVSAYVSNNAVDQHEIGELIEQVHGALRPRVDESETPLRPAASVRRSVSPDYLICLEDGRKFTSLRRHLRVHHDLTPQQYRDRWELPETYPMVAPNYSAKRSTMAKALGLGRPHVDTPDIAHCAEPVADSTAEDSANSAPPSLAD